MKILKLSVSAICLIMAINTTSCSSSDNSSWFQKDDEPAEFSLFHIFDDYPSISEAWDKVEQYVFNQGLAELITETPTDRLKDVLGLMDDLVDPALKPTEPLFNTLESLRVILNNVVDQDNLDAETGSTTYYTDLVSFLDKLSGSRANFSENLVPVVANLILYLNVVHGDEIDEITHDLLYLLRENGPAYDGLATDGNDPAAQNIHNMLPMLQEALSKLLLRNNENIHLDSGYNLVTGGTGPLDTGLGNAVEGIDLLLSGLNGVSQQDRSVITNLSAVLREAGRATSKNANGTLFKNVLRELMINLEKYFTKEGSVYSASADYHRDAANVAGVNYYVDSEIKNTVRELLPVLQLLMIRADKTDFAILKDDGGRSPLEVIAASLGQLRNNGIDFSAYDLEDSLKQMVEKNASGADRAASDASYLERLLFTLAIASSFGYKTSMTDANDPYPNHGRGHGVSTNGTMTLNDSMYNMRSNAFMTLNAYSLALDKRVDQAAFIGRSATTQFSGAQIGSHRFYLGYDYPAFFLMPGACAGDAGIPNGGESAITPTTNTTGADWSENDYRTYYPKVANGVGETNTAAVMMGMIARICWEGEGPYYATAGATTGAGGTTYYRPDGRIYAIDNGGAFTYPVDGGNDVDDGAGQRANRFSEKLESDYFLVQAGFLGEYCPPPINTANTGANFVQGASGLDTDNMPLKYKMKSSASHGAQKFMFWEKIHEDSSDRACATQEEAMFRNFQWLVNEKKFVFTIPMWVESLGMDSAAYIVIEANGLAGLALAQKGGQTANPEEGNGEWLLLQDEGTGVIAGAELARRGMTVNYGDSYLPGDARVMVFCREDTSVTLGLLWENILGKGHVLPDVIVQNFGPMPRMAFLENGPALGSGSGDWTTSGSDWEGRSRLLPLVIAAVGELHKGSYYEVPSGGTDYNYNHTSANHKYPLRTVLAGLIPPLVKPWMRHLEDASGAAADVTWGKRWVPRLKDESMGIHTYLSPSVVWDDATNTWVLTNIDMRPRTSIRTLVNLMIEDDPGMHNGLIPLLTETKTVSRLLAMLQGMQSSAVTTETREKIFKGLEQVMTALRVSKGDVIAREEQGEATPVYGDDSYTQVDYGKLQWLMFDYDNGDPDTGNPIGIRALDTNLDVLLDELIGCRDLVAGDTLARTGRGLAGFVNRRESGSAANTFYETYRLLPDGHHWNWDNFNRMMDGMRSLMADDGPNGTTYYIMNDVAALVEKFLSRVSATDAELKGMRHTLGTLMASYDSGSAAWTTPTHLRDVLTVYLPDIMTTFNGHYDDLMIVAYNLFRPHGLMPYMLNGLSTHYSWSVVFRDLNDLLQDPFFTDPAARPSIWIGENSLPAILVNMADMIGSDWYMRLVYLGPGASVAPTVDGLLTEDGEALEFDPYKTLGRLLNGGGR